MILPTLTACNSIDQTSPARTAIATAIATMPKTYKITVDNQNERVPVDATDVIVEEGITKLKYRTFIGCELLRSIIFPQSLEEIEDDSFGYCASLESIFIPKNVTKIGNWAFTSCYALCEVVFEEGSKLEFIGEGAFQCCESLQSMKIPESVTSLGDCAFG